MTIQKLAQQALDIQDACNLSGVVHAFSRAMDVLWAEARAHNHGTDWINTHPIVTLFIDKLASLNRTQYDTSAIIAAYPRVAEIAQGVTLTPAYTNPDRSYTPTLDADIPLGSIVLPGEQIIEAKGVKQ